MYFKAFNSQKFSKKNVKEKNRQKNKNKFKIDKLFLGLFD